jgi:hypothetical protein
MRSAQRHKLYLFIKGDTMSEWTKAVIQGVMMVAVIVALMVLITLVLVKIIPKRDALPSCVMTAQEPFTGRDNQISP